MGFLRSGQRSMLTLEDALGQTTHRSCSPVQAFSLALVSTMTDHSQYPDASCLDMVTPSLESGLAIPALRYPSLLQVTRRQVLGLLAASFSSSLIVALQLGSTRDSPVHDRRWCCALATSSSRQPPAPQAPKAVAPIWRLSKRSSGLALHR